MLQQLRRLRISLAAKLQLLFGAAVALIICAALFVPWYRMEQLMEQLNRVAADAVAEQAVQEHLREAPLRRPVTDRNPAPAPSTQPADELPRPRLVRLAADDKSAQLSSFERRAIQHLLQQPDRRLYARYFDLQDGTVGYRYAKPLFLSENCLSCHAATATPAAAQVTLGQGQPTTAPAAQLPFGIVSVAIPSQVEPNELLLNRVVMFTAALLAGTLAVFVFYLITTRLILRPVRVLQETAEKVSEGDLNIRSHINTGDEFQQLSETFNTMLANLKNSSDQLRAINKGLDLKLNEMAQTNVALYEASKLKSEFLANVSHELRTPLNSILGFAELLKDTTPADAKNARYVQNIFNSGKHLLDLINDLLDLAKIEAGRMEVRSEPLSLSDLFEGLSGILKPLCQAKNVTIDDRISTDVPIIHTDPGKLQQVLYNFLSNAIKFSPAGGTIDLKAQREDADHVRIIVTDRGPGIEPEKHAVIFEKFRQLDGSATRQHSGTGLGLSISKELVELLGGSIGVRSTPGQGATFWVVLPLRIQAAEHDLRPKAPAAT